MRVTPELLPCPFCGWEPSIFHDVRKKDDAQVICDCGASGPIEDAGSGLSAHAANYAANHWNRRASKA